jgi:hypothetical protein
VAHRVGWGFITLYTLAYMSTSLLFIAPLLVTLALKVNSLVGIERAPESLALVAGTGALLAMVGNPFFGAGLQRGHVPRRQLQAHNPVQVRRRLIRGEAQLGRANLGQLAARPQPGQRQRGRG